MSKAKKPEPQPWLKYIVLPLLLILFGLVVSYAILSQQKQADFFALPSIPITPTPSPTPTQYTCPKTAWVNCMPGPNAPERPQCTSEFYAWAKANCPDFEGLAY